VSSIFGNCADSREERQPRLAEAAPSPSIQIITTEIASTKLADLGLSYRGNPAWSKLPLCTGHRYLRLGARILVADPLLTLGVGKFP
jgi:hypothetical protein